MSEDRFVWDKVVRLTHWLVAACVLSNFFLSSYSSSAELYAGFSLHEWIGSLAVTLVILRLIWSLTGAKKPARLRDLIPTPSGMNAHWQELRQRKASDEPGHNSFGLLAIWAMWFCLLGLGTTGWLTYSDWGFDHDIGEVHGFFAKLLQIIVILHISAVFLTWWWCRHNLLKPMIHR